MPVYLFPITQELAQRYDQVGRPVQEVAGVTALPGSLQL